MNPEEDEHIMTLDAESELRAARSEIAILRKALAKLDAIRNSIIGHQTVNWSEHVYPLVAALAEAGYEGESYDVSRAKAETLHQRIKQLEATLEDSVRHWDTMRTERDAALSEVKSLRTVLVYRCGCRARRLPDLEPPRKCSRHYPEPLIYDGADEP